MRIPKVAAAPRRRAYTIVVITLAIAAWFLPGMLDRDASAAGAKQSEAASLTQVRNRGAQPVELTAVDAQALERFSQSGDSLGDVSLLATRGGRLYYRIANQTGHDCFAVGPAQPMEYRLGQIMCAAAFPSEAQPLLDFTVLRQPEADASSARVLRSEGIAANGIAEIGFETADGRVVAVTPVMNNVYHVVAPPGQHVTRLVARDASGAVLWAVPFTAVTLA